MVIDIFGISQVLYSKVSIHRIIGVNIEQILDSTPLCILRSFRYLIYLEPLTTSFLSEEHHGMMHSGRVNMLNEVVITSIRALRTYSSSILSSEL